ncbi:MAG: leucyl aminopeptidase family protein [Kineosporiaceae bacterium]
MSVPISELVSGEPHASVEADEVLATTVGRPVEGEQVVIDTAGRRAATAHGVDLDAVLRAEKVRGRAGEVTRVPVASVHWLLIGVGDGGPDDLRRAGAALGRRVRGRRALTTSLVTGRDRDRVRAGVTGLLLGGYSPPATGTKNRDDARAVRRITLLGSPDATAVAAGRRDAEATVRARVLAVTPSSIKNPAWMVEQARQVADESGLTITVWDADRLAAEGFGGLVAVGGGSATPPALVRLDHRPETATGTARRARQAPVVLIGKGITFDTGGISLKPRAAMVPMKTDMSGSAAVLAVLAACRAAGVRRPVTGLLPLAENSFGGASYRPADVITSYGGRTIEIANTDAEGRLVLADALAYADAHLNPEVMIDVATLTGAATMALGRRHAALFTPDDALARSLQAAADASGERVWRMPLVEDYAPALRSEVADLRHVPIDGSIGGGAITAALFLQAFAGRRRWAHLDIAGVARSDKDSHEVCKGATGYGARLLLRYLEALR